jgi:hypothetical protein
MPGTACLSAADLAEELLDGLVKALAQEANELALVFWAVPLTLLPTWAVLALFR